MPNRTVRLSRATITNTIAIALATAVSAALAPAAATAQFDAFIKFPPAVGASDAQRSAHKGEIEIQSFSWGASQPSHAGGGSGGMGAGKVSMQDMSVMRTTPADGSPVAGDDAAAHTVKSPRDAASGQASGKRTHPALIKIEKPLEPGSLTMTMKFADCTVGTRFPSAEVTTPLARYILKEVLITSCVAAGSGGESLPTESVSLNYSKVEVRGWDPKKKEE